MDSNPFSMNNAAPKASDSNASTGEQSSDGWHTVGKTRSAYKPPPAHSTTSNFSIVTRSRKPPLSLPLTNTKEYDIAGTDYSSFRNLQEIICPIISNWSTSPDAKKHKFHQIWLTLWRDNITNTTTWNVIKRKFKFNNFQEYYDMLITCPAIVTQVQMLWNENLNKIAYKLRSNFTTSTSTDTPIIAAITATIPSTSHEDDLSMPAPVTIPDTMTFTVLTQDPSDSPDQNQDELQSTHIQNNATDTKPEPPPENKNLLSDLTLDIEEEETASDGTHKNRFLHHFLDKYNAKMGEFGNQIKTTMQTLNNTVQHINQQFDTLKSQYQTFETYAKTTVHDTKEQLKEMSDKISYYHATQENMLQTYGTRCAQVRTYHETQLNTTLKNTINQLHHEIEPVIINHHAQLDALTTESILNIETLHQDCVDHLNSIIESHKQTPLYTAQAPHTSPRNTYSSPNKQPFSNRNRWGNNINSSPVAAQSYTMPDKRHYPPYTNQWHPAPIFPQYHRDGDPQYYHPRHILPIVRLDHHNFINKADIKYNGKIFTFYNKLLNFGHQYGVYLLPLQELRHDQSLCPDEVDGYRFTDIDYKRMAATLLEKLTRSDVIPEEYTKMKNIIDRYIDSNDGYQALYELLEPHHGLLQKRIKIKAPDSADYNGDIHEYTAQFYSFLTSEGLHGRTYNAEEQVTAFLSGLDDSFAPAVDHINNLLDSWGQPGLNPKCELRRLPSTIDDFMNRHPYNPKYPSVRMLNSTSLPELTDTDIIHVTKQRLPLTTDSHESRKPIDIFCDACGGHGHPWKRCDYLARLIKALDFTTKLDKNKQIEILQAFTKEQQRLRENKIKRNISKARTLKDSGDIEGLYKLLTEDPDDWIDSTCHHE